MSQAVETLEIQIKATSKDLKKSISDAKREFSALDDQASVSISADISEAADAIDELEDRASDIEGGTVEIDGDIDDAEDAIDDIEGQAENVEGGTVEIDGDIEDAEDAIDDIEDQAANVQGGELVITADTSDAMDQMDAVEGKAKGIVSLMKAAGLVAFGKMAADFAMESIDAASNKIDGVETRVDLLLRNSAGAREELYGYAQEMYDLYGFNKTGILDMSAGFVSALKDSYGEDQAVAMAERLTSAAIDYAYAVGKTPGEVADIFMSLLRGRGQAAAQLDILDLTTEKIEETMQALDAEKTGLPKGWEAMSDEQKKFYAGLLLIEKKSDELGYTGYLENNYNTYAVQNERLAQEWQTTKELTGTVLYDIATNVKTYTADILHAINEYAEGMNKSTFAKDTEGYFGNMELTEVDISNIVSIITAPVSQITDAVADLKKKLGQAEKDLRTAYSDFEKALFMQEEGVGDAADTVAAAEKMGEEAIAKNEAKARSLGEVFVAFVDPEDPAWAEATSLALTAIDTYYNALNDKVNERTEALVQALKDGNTELARELATQQMEAAFNDSRYAVMAKQELALDNAAQGVDWGKEGVLSAETVEKLVKAATEATSEERAQLKTARDNLLVGLLEALYYQADQEGWSEETRIAKVAEVKASVNDRYDAALAEMDASMRAKVWDVVMANGMDQLLQNAKEEVLSGDSYGKASRQLFSFFDEISSVEGFEDTMPDEMRQMYAVYDRFKRNFGNPYDENYKNDAEYIGQTAGNEHIKRAYEVDKDWFDDVFVRGLSAAEANLIHYGTEKDNTGDIGLSHAQIEGYQDLAAAERENNAQTAQALLNQMEASEALYSMLSGGTRDQLFDYIEDAAGQSADRTIQLLDAVLTDMEQYIDQATPEDAIFSWMRNFEETESTGNEYGEAGSIIEDAADKMKGVASEYKAALASLPERIRVLVNMHVGKYALGRAMNEAAGVYASIG